jgi:hypothetical protein
MKDSGCMTQKVTMYVGSMDHSPSEQLGDPDRWHTTVLILSETASQSQLATELLESANGVPKKWSKSSQIHKDQFESVLAARLGGLHVRAISAQGKKIESSLDNII